MPRASGEVMKMYRADLHIHSCLSPCADLEMSPKHIALELREKGIHIAGICDHNSAENVPGVMRATRDFSIHVIGGIEITSREEVHIMGLFDRRDNLFAMQAAVYRQLEGENDPDRFGMQIVANEKDEVLGFNSRLLIGATHLSVEEIVHYIHRFDGLAVASHIDREGFGIIGQLGFIPQDLPLDAVEVSSPEKAKEFHHLPYPVITSSDAHFLKDIGKSVTVFFVEEVNLREIKKSLLQEDGRRVELEH